MQNDIKHLTILSTFAFTFIVGVCPRGITFPSPLFMHCPQCNIYKYTTKVSKILKKMWVLCLHSILVLLICIFKTIPGPLDLYYLYGSIPEPLNLTIQYSYLMHLKGVFFLHLNHIPTNDIISIRYIIFEKRYMEYIMNRH
jgi:hypothetical protein